ncbi:MAG: hypothetical protein EXQ52_12200 [Bryobacterales bacterium]|nr:hypothetical protein [Bryobacterales bacterium]
MQTIHRTPAATVICLLLALAPQVRAGEPFRMVISFDFHVHEKVLPAGEYQINFGTDALQIKSDAGSAYLLTPVSRSQRATPRLVFRRYGSEYFLAEIWTQTGIRRLPPGEREEELIERGVRPERTTLTARR